MSEAGFKNNKDKFELNREPVRLPEDNADVDPWHLRRRESPVHPGRATHKKIQQLNLQEPRHFQGRSPGCGVEGWGPQPLRNRDRRYGRRRIKNEEICPYSNQEEVNHRWGLNEMGKSKAAQNFKVKLESWQDLCGFRLKACKTTCAGHVSLKGWSRKLFNSELSFGFLIKPQTKKTVLRVGVGS